MAQEMGGKFRGEFSAVSVSPQQFGSLTVRGNTDDSQVGFRIGLHI